MNLGSEGKEISLDEDSEEWSALHVEPGAVLEVALEATNLGGTDESWAAFFVEKLENRLDGSYLLTTEWLGVESDSLVSLLEAFFGDGVPKLHRAWKLGLATRWLRPCCTSPASAGGDQTTSKQIISAATRWTT